MRKERKVVTVLFADLVGFTARSETLDPEEVEAVLEPFRARLTAELERHGGVVEKFIGDAVMAVFGAPATHEDDAERAVRAALAIRDWAAEDGGLEVRIAVNTGEALVSLDARPEAGQGLVAGDVVNTAARLQAAAPVNGILVGDATYRVTRNVIDYRPGAPVVAKGKAAPVPVWEAVEARSRVGVDVRQHGKAALVGRERELDLLQAALGHVRDEHATQLVTLVGVPGIGKSRLVHELFQLVQGDLELIEWRQGRCLPYGDGVTYWALSEMVKAHAGILDSDPHDEVARKLAEAVGDDWLERHLRPLVGLAEDRHPSGDRRAEAFAAWRRFFESAAEQRPLVLVFEDLHWADEDLLDFVDHLVEWVTGVPLLVVGTARPELLDRRPGWGGGKPNAATLSLVPLDDEETARLVHSLLDLPALPADVQSHLIERSGGNPLYAEEFARLYAECGHRPGVPDTVHGIIAARLDALAPEDKAILQDAAIVGKVFWLGTVAAVGGRDRAPCEERLHVLERREFVRRERRPSVAEELEYAFRHVLVRDVAYGQIPRAERFEKHRACAEWIARRGRLEDHAEMLAHHYLSALEYARPAGVDAAVLGEPARRALSEAGGRAFRLHAYGTSARFYGAALELWPADDPERPRVLFRHARSVYMSEGGGEAELEAARDALIAAGDPGTAAEAEALRADLSWQRGHRDETFARIERALGLASGAEPSSSTAYALSQASRFNMLAGHYGEATRLGREALALADSLALDEIRAHALNNIGMARVELGDAAGVEDLERSAAIAEAVKSPEVLRAYQNLAATAIFLGDLAAAREYHERGRHAALRLAVPLALRFAEGSAAAFCFMEGDWDWALRLADAFIAASDDAPHYLEGQNRLVRAAILHARGDDERPRYDMERALDLARSVQDPQVLSPALGFSAALAFEAGGRAEAAALIDELVELASHGEGVGHDPASVVWMTAIALGRGEDLLRASKADRSRSRWVEAARALVAGELVRAADVYAELGSLPDEAATRLAAAEGLVAAGRRAEGDEQLGRALAFYRSVGATRYLRRGEALLAAAG